MGSINKDIQVRTDRWPEPGETVMAKDQLTIGGGKAANRAFIACKLGAPALLLARLGDDQEAEEAIRPLQDMGVNLDHVKRMEGQRTGLSLIAVRPDGKKSILLAGNVNKNWEEDGPRKVGDAILAAPEGSVLSVDLEIPAEVVKQALKAAKERGFLVVLDPSPASDFREEYFELADFITPNKTEAESLVGFEVKDPESGFRACAAMAEKGARHALVKLGKEGWVMISEGNRVHVPAPKAKVVDTTGAGDAFAGALAFALWEKQKPAEALRFAAVASTLATEVYGSQPAYPDREKVEKKMAESEE